MPATFESFGVKFLYPDNCTLVERDEEEGNDGVTLELPSGGFFSVERDREGELPEEIVEELTGSFEADYGEVEREELKLETLREGDRAFEFRFYYLDLLIISRLLVVTRNDVALLIQIQAESRDFAANEMVFNAILKQIDEA